VACKGGVGECVQGAGTESHVRHSGGWETVLKLIVNNLRSYIKKILNWLRDLDSAAEGRDK